MLTPHTKPRISSGSPDPNKDPLYVRDWTRLRTAEWRRRLKARREPESAVIAMALLAVFLDLIREQAGRPQGLDPMLRRLIIDLLMKLHNDGKDLDRVMDRIKKLEPKLCDDSIRFNGIDLLFAT